MSDWQKRNQRWCILQSIDLRFQWRQLGEEIFNFSMRPSRQLSEVPLVNWVLCDWGVTNLMTRSTNKACSTCYSVTFLFGATCIAKVCDSFAPAFFQLGVCYSEVGRTHCRTHSSPNPHLGWPGEWLHQGKRDVQKSCSSSPWVRSNPDTKDQRNIHCGGFRMGFHWLVLLKPWLFEVLGGFVQSGRCVQASFLTLATSTSLPFGLPATCYQDRRAVGSNRPKICQQSTQSKTEKRKWQRPSPVHVRELGEWEHAIEAYGMALKARCCSLWMYYCFLWHQLCSNRSCKGDVVSFTKDSVSCRPAARVFHWVFCSSWAWPSCVFLRWIRIAVRPGRIWRSPCFNWDVVTYRGRSWSRPGRPWSERLPSTPGRGRCTWVQDHKAVSRKHNKSCGV